MNANMPDAANNPGTKYVVVGRLGRSYGLAGWQHVQTYTHPNGNIFQFKRWFVWQKEGWQPFEVEAYKQHANSWLVKLSGVTEKEQAALYSNKNIAILRNELPKLEKGEFYWADLEGLNVITKEGVALGSIEYLYENTDLTVMVVKAKGKERHIPFLLEDTVLEVDFIDNLVTVDWDFA